MYNQNKFINVLEVFTMFIPKKCRNVSRVIIVVNLNLSSFCVKYHSLISVLSNTRRILN